MNFLFSSMVVYSENDLCGQISYLYLFFKIETFNNKEVIEVRCIIECVYRLISFHLSV